MFGIDWDIFIEERLPNAVRKPILFAWFHALLGPVKSLHTAFLTFKGTTERHVSITPQVCFLRYWLNELFDTAERRFEINDYTNSVPIRIYGQAENKPLYLPKFLSGKAYDFEVLAPCEASGQKVQIKGFLDKYKLAGKRYKLRFVDNVGNPCSIVAYPALEEF